MKKEQILERTERIYLVGLEMGTDLSQMSQFLVQRIKDTDKPNTILEEDFIVKLTGMASKISSLMNKNAKGLARINETSEICESMNNLKKDFMDSYRKEIKETPLEKIVLNVHVIRKIRKSKEEGDTEI